MMPGEADRLRKLLQEMQDVAADETRRRKRAEERAAELERQNEIMAERVHHLEAKKDELERQNAILAGRLPLEEAEVVWAGDRTARLSKLEDEVKRLAAAYDSWGLMRDNHTSRLESIEGQVLALALGHPQEMRRWWQR